jgi:hypothetical protein
MRLCNNGAREEVPNRLWIFVCLFALFEAYLLIYFVHNAATVSYDRKELLDIRTAITHHRLAVSFFPLTSLTSPCISDRMYIPQPEAMDYRQHPH